MYVLGLGETRRGWDGREALLGEVGALLKGLREQLETARERLEKRWRERGAALAREEELKATLAEREERIRALELQGPDPLFPLRQGGLQLLLPGQGRPPLPPPLLQPLPGGLQLLPQALQQCPHLPQKGLPTIPTTPRLPQSQHVHPPHTTLTHLR
ncbi:hypothetical protein CSW40_09340, partial [Thermus scotoductus]